jgi:hypothetical protein
MDIITFANAYRLNKGLLSSVPGVPVAQEPAPPHYEPLILVAAHCTSHETSAPGRDLHSEGPQRIEVSPFLFFRGGSDSDLERWWGYGGGWPTGGRTELNDAWVLILPPSPVGDIHSLSCGC